MKNAPLRDRFRLRGLFPYQADFAVRVLTEPPPACLLLEGPPGSGLTHTLSLAALEGIEEGVFRRVLWLSSARRLAEATRETLLELTCEFPVELVDRAQLREFEAAVSRDSEIWPNQGIFIATMEFASRPEVSLQFIEAHWDLVVIDEAHCVTTGSARSEFAKQLVSKGTALTVLTGYKSRADLNDLIQGMKSPVASSTTVWQLSDLRDWDGNSFTRKLVVWEKVPYQMGKDEADFYESLEETSSALDYLLRNDSVKYESLMSRAMSCLYTVEQALMNELSRLRRRSDELVYRHGPRNARDTFVDWENDIEFDDLEFLSCYEAVSDQIEEARNRLEMLETDSKSKAAITLLQRFEGQNVCILSQYAATVAYLHTVIAEEEGLELTTLTARLSRRELKSQLEQFRSRRGLILATDAIIQGIELPDIDVVINYDLPLSPERLHYRASRFNRYRPGSVGIVKMVSLVEENAVTGRMWEKTLAIASEFSSS